MWPFGIKLELGAASRGVTFLKCGMLCTTFVITFAGLAQTPLSQPKRQVTRIEGEVNPRASSRQLTGPQGALDG